MHTRKMSDSEGQFGSWQQAHGKCPRCGQEKLRFKESDSHDGAYTDEKYNCQACGHHWWVEGPDA